MSYIPDYRGEVNEKLLSKEDKSYLEGFRYAMECADDFFSNIEAYDFTEAEKYVIEKAHDCLDHWMALDEVETVCSLFENADYISEDIDLVDANNSKK